MIKVPIDPTVELRSADGTSSEYYQTNETHIQESRPLLADPRLLAQRHLLLSSRYRASMIPCQGIDIQQINDLDLLKHPILPEWNHTLLPRMNRN